ncbi:tetratricopeptide repeat protein 25 [Aplysia californica]|uniref:Outer dynein arm-docking complex subunit 4 n=1 Tax=Aplysia californica TaxID=6500 RepID=A0ABM0ZXE2_APLCA|nr:tetratricopeptide repeat protein 25 [Aplysia californica]
MYGAGGDDESDGLPGTYEIYKAEADALFKNGDYRKAIESYTTALQLRQDDRICLVCRSKCHLMLGDTNKALQDAEAALVEDKNYHKGMFQKAEALYNRGDFELALVFYHRGNRLRPELQDFRLGIQKAQEAINNCVGTPERVKLDTTGDLSFFKAQDEKKTKRKGQLASQRPQTVPKRKRQMERSAQNERTIRQMLGELYGDKQYLEKLLKETEMNTDTGRKINSLAEEGLSYLDTRTEFWQQVKPMYARQYESRQAMTRGRNTKTTPHEYILSELEKIDHLMSETNYSGALKRAQKVMTVLDGYTETQLANKMTFKANVFSVQGNAYLELGDYGNATKQHQADLSIGDEHGIMDAKSRGLDNLGRVYARMGKFQKAIEVWERKLPMSKTNLETTWLCHELGRCYLELDQAKTAKDYGERSLAAAQEAEDDMWQLHALVLISQSEVKSGRLSSSLISFEKAYELANLLMDTSAQAAIKKAIDDVNTKIARREQEGGEEPDDTMASDQSAGDKEKLDESKESAKEDGEEGEHEEAAEG